MRSLQKVQLVYAGDKNELFLRTKEGRAMQQGGKSLFETDSNLGKLHYGDRQQGALAEKPGALKICISILKKINILCYTVNRTHKQKTD